MRFSQNLFFLISLPFCLVACNGGEDFSDAIIDGPIWGLESDQPPASTDDHVAVELVAGATSDGINMTTAIVTGLNYECGNVRARVTSTGVARCWTTASQVRYWLGPLDKDSTGSWPELTIGTYYLPMCSGRTTEDDSTSCSGGSGSFQATLSEMIPAHTTSTDTTLRQAPAYVEPADNRVINRAALLNALDVNADSHIIEIPDEAHNLTARMPGTGNAQFERDYTDLDDDNVDRGFAGEIGTPQSWATWLDLVTRELNGLSETDTVDPNTHTVLSFIPVATFTDPRRPKLVTTATQRVRAGFYSIEHDYLTYGLLDSDVYVAMEIPFLVLPTGEVAGVGTLLALSSSQDTSNPIKVQQIPLYLDADARLSDSLRLASATGSTNIWTAKNIAATDTASITFQGRVIGSLMYDDATEDEDGKTDYELDYPVSGAYTNAPYTMVANDRGQFQGSATVEIIPSGSSSSTPTSRALTFDARPIRIGRTQYSSAYLHEDTLAKFKYYRLTLMRACSPLDDQSGCTSIPDAEKGVNYSEYYVLGGTDDCDSSSPTAADCTFMTVEKHQVNTTLDVELLDDGTLVSLTDAASNCGVAVDGNLMRGATQERRIGYVSRTVDSSEDARESAFLAILISGDEATALRGTEIQARVKLSGTTAEAAPAYRLSDDNYDAAVPASWVDYFSQHQYANAEDLLNLATDENTGVPTSAGDQNKLYHYYTLAGGSVYGKRLDSTTCAEVP